MFNIISIPKWSYFNPLFFYFFIRQFFISIPKWSYFNPIITGAIDAITKFQSQNGLILTFNMISYWYNHYYISIPKWSYFNEQNKVEQQQRLVISIPKWSYFNVIIMNNNSANSTISIPKWSYFNTKWGTAKIDHTKFQSQNGLILTPPS